MTATLNVRSPKGASRHLELSTAVPSRLVLAPAMAGDHQAIYHLLLAILQGPSPSEYQAQLEEPLYEPCDRATIKLGDQLLGHAHTTKRVFQFGGLRVPAGEIRDLVTLPEFRGRGLGSALLAAAERKLLAGGALVALLRTNTPAFFVRRGWSAAIRQCFSTVSVRQLLGQLHDEPERQTPASRGALTPLNIRLWRHVEQEPLMRLHAQGVAAAYGAWQRNEPYWRWLITRHGYERLYVAIAGPDRLELTDERAPIVGYAATKRNRVVELHTLPGHEHAARQLLDRIGHDAIERNDPALRYDGPPNDSLHALFSAAGGQHTCREVDDHEVLLAKVLDWRGWLSQLAPLLFERAKLAGLETPCDLGLEWPSGKLGLHVSQRSAKVVSPRMLRSRLRGSASALTQLTLGHSSVQELMAAGRMEATTRQASHVAAVLFPRLPLWIPPLDELPG